MIQIRFSFCSLDQGQFFKQLQAIKKMMHRQQHSKADQYLARMRSDHAGLKGSSLFNDILFLQACNHLNTRSYSDAEMVFQNILRFSEEEGSRGVEEQGELFSAQYNLSRFYLMTDTSQGLKRVQQSMKSHQWSMTNQQLSYMHLLQGVSLSHRI